MTYKQAWFKFKAVMQELAIKKDEEGNPDESIIYGAVYESMGKIEEQKNLTEVMIHLN